MAIKTIKVDYNKVITGDFRTPYSKVRMGNYNVFERDIKVIRKKKSGIKVKMRDPIFGKWFYIIIIPKKKKRRKK